MASNTKNAIVTLDLESDYAGQLSHQYSLWTKQNITALTTFIQKNNVPLTVFVVANTLLQYPNIINAFSKTDVSFHLHSFTHNLNQPDSNEEISRGISAFKQYFGHMPLGYRAPEGRMSIQGLTRLKSAGIMFDASESPSFRPRFHNMLKPIKTIYQPIPGLWEIPFTVISPFRIPFSLSWVKLIGWKSYLQLLELSDIPTITVFNFHLHDLWQSDKYGQLSPFWKYIYHRHKNDGFKYFSHILNYLKVNGYTFSTIENVLPK